MNDLMDAIYHPDRARRCDVPTCEFCHEEIGTPALVWCEYGDGGISLTAIAEHDPRTLFTSRLYRHWHTGCLPHALVSHTALAA